MLVPIIQGPFYFSAAAGNAFFTAAIKSVGRFSLFILNFAYYNVKNRTLPRRLQYFSSKNRCRTISFDALSYYILNSQSYCNKTFTLIQTLSFYRNVRCLIVLYPNTRGDHVTHLKRPIVSGGDAVWNKIYKI